MRDAVYLLCHNGLYLPGGTQANIRPKSPQELGTRFSVSLLQGCFQSLDTHKRPGYSMVIVDGASHTSRNRRYSSIKHDHLPAFFFCPDLVDFERVASGLCCVAAQAYPPFRVGPNLYHRHIFIIVTLNQFYNSAFYLSSLQVDSFR